MERKEDYKLEREAILRRKHQEVQNLASAKKWEECLQNLKEFISLPSEKRIELRYVVMSKLPEEEKVEMLEYFFSKEIEAEGKSEQIFHLLQICSGDKYVPVRVFEWILSKKVDINRQDPKGKTPLMIACRSGFKFAVKMLVKKGAECDLKDNEGKTALHHECMSDFPIMENIQMLVERMKNVDVRDKKNMNALFYASKNCRTCDEILMLLIERGSSPWIRNKKRNSIFKNIVGKGRPESFGIAKKCLEKKEGMFVDDISSVLVVFVKQLVMAGEVQEHFVRLLLESGGDPNF